MGECVLGFSGAAVLYYYTHGQFPPKTILKNQTVPYRRRLLAGTQLRVARAWLRMDEAAEARRLLSETVLRLDADYGPARTLLAALGG